MGARRSSPHRKERTSGTSLADSRDLERDLELVRLACQGAQGALEAWKALYLHYKDFLWRFTHFQLKLPQEFGTGKRREVRGNTITAEQFLNEVYIRMWERKRFCAYKGHSSFQWWYATVVANIYSDLCREEGRNLPPGARVPLEEEDDE
jgi:DNA-directed RNA polymerase specialized sigma24 family protein